MKVPAHMVEVPTLICSECGMVASCRFDVQTKRFHVEEYHGPMCSHATSYEIPLEEADDGEA